MANEPIPQAKKDEMARGLQQKLRRARPNHTLRLTVAGLLLSVVLVVLYFVSRPRPEPPPLLLVLPDAVQLVRQPIQVEARLSAAGDPNASLLGEKVLWRRLGGAELPTTPAPANGRARLELPPVPTEEVISLQASYVEPRQIYRRDDLGRIFVWEKSSPVLLVPMEGGLWDGGEFRPDARVDAERIEPIKKASAQRKVVYATRETDPVRYRQVRLWLQRQHAAGLPDGPLLIGDAAEVQAELGRRLVADHIVPWAR